MVYEPKRTQTFYGFDCKRDCDCQIIRAHEIKIQFDSAFFLYVRNSLRPNKMRNIFFFFFYVLIIDESSAHLHNKTAYMIWVQKKYDIVKICEL